jgi:hypothetical protein
MQDDIDTSGPGAEIDVPEEKDESIVETEPKETNQETKTTDQETNLLKNLMEN